MNGYEFALKMEQDGKAYYENLASISADASVRQIFTMLAADEQMHYEMIRDGGRKLPDSGLMEFAENVFTDLDSASLEIPFEAGEEGLRHALDIEYKSIKLYEELAGETGDQDERAFFEKLVSEEGNHYLLIENLLDHLSGGLLRGIESAEFTPLDPTIL